MAIVNSITLGKSRGSLGNVTLRYVGGDTIASQKILKGTQKLGTYAQVSRRVRLANLVNAYRGLNACGNGAGMYQAFPSRPPRVSNFNMFVSRNMALGDVGGIVLTQSQANEGDCICAPYRVSEGSLPVISSQVVTSFSEDAVVSLNTTDNVLQFWNTGATSGWSGFCASLMETYGLMSGDTVTVFVQEWKEGNDVKFDSFQFVIDPDAEDIPEGIDEIIVDTRVYFATTRLMLNAGSKGSVAVVVGRKSSGGYLTSTSEFILTDDMRTAKAAYESRSALDAAIASYGYRTDPYLQQNVNP